MLRHTGYYLPRMLTSVAFFCGRDGMGGLGGRRGEMVGGFGRGIVVPDSGML